MITRETADSQYAFRITEVSIILSQVSTFLQVGMMDFCSVLAEFRRLERLDGEIYSCGIPFRRTKHS